MKKQVKAVLFFLGIVLVGALIILLTNNPQILQNIGNFFAGISLQTYLLFLGGAGIIVLGFFSFRYMKKKKGKKSKKKSKKKDKNESGENKEKKKEKPKLKPRLKKKLKNLKGTKTKMDVFYSEIKDKEEISIPDLSEEFGISKDKTLDWCKILEKDEKVKIEYPTFSSPVVKLKKPEDEESKEESKESKEKSGKKSKSKKSKKSKKPKSKNKNKKKSSKGRKKKSSKNKSKKSNK